MLGSLTAVGSACYLTIRHRSDLRIPLKQSYRYWLKSINLALCYRGFSPSKSLQSAIRAGRAAFYCCVYDVITDWHNYDLTDYEWFKRLLAREVPNDVASIAQKLYQQEQNQSLLFDGLSRGIDALESIAKLIGCEEYLRHYFDFTYLGIVMQIVDDVLDFEHDQRRREINCLLTSPERRSGYLKLLMSFDLKEFKNRLPHSSILCLAIRSAQKKALRLFPMQKEHLSEVSEWQKMVNKKPSSDNGRGHASVEKVTSFP